MLHRRFSGQEGCRAAFMRVAGLAGGDIAPGMLEEVVVEMLSLPVVREKMKSFRCGSGWGRAGGGGGGGLLNDFPSLVLSSLDAKRECCGERKGGDY